MNAAACRQRQRNSPAQTKRTAVRAFRPSTTCCRRSFAARLTGQPCSEGGHHVPVREAHGRNMIAEAACSRSSRRTRRRCGFPLEGFGPPNLLNGGFAGAGCLRMGRQPEGWSDGVRKNTAQLCGARPTSFHCHGQRSRRCACPGCRWGHRSNTRSPRRYGRRSCGLTSPLWQEQTCPR